MIDTHKPRTGIGTKDQGLAGMELSQLMCNGELLTSRPYMFH